MKFIKLLVIGLFSVSLLGACENKPADEEATSQEATETAPAEGEAVEEEGAAAGDEAEEPETPPASQ